MTKKIAHNSNLASCLHCGSAVRNLRAEFCCIGCKAAYGIINNLSLSKYYEYCRTIYNTHPPKVQEVVNEINYLDHVTEQEGSFSISLLVGGIQCGSCIWLIEHVLSQASGVISARLNLSTNRLVIKWAAEKAAIQDMVKIIMQLGFSLTPFDATLLDDERLQAEKTLLRSIAVAGFALGNVMLLAIGVWAGNWFSYIGDYTRTMIHIISGIISVPAVLYSALPFFRSALKALQYCRSNMDIPISIAIFATLLISIQEAAVGGLYTYFDAALSLTLLLLVGRYLDLKARNKARAEAQTLLLNQPRSVTLFEEGKYRLVDINRVTPGEIAFVAVGERIPVDGEIIEGESELDNSLITGETTPEGVKPGTWVHAGTINLGSPIKILIKKIGDNTLLGEILKLMELAEQGRAKYVQLADRIARYYTPIVLTLAIGTAVFWYYLKGAALSKALLYAVSVMIITCPCASGLAVPVVQVVASGRLLRQGIFPKTADALERIARINMIIFDKTGTLTLGRPTLRQESLKDLSKEQYRIAVSLASQSKHPLCKALTASYSKDDLFNVVTKETEGMGVTGTIKGKEYKLGNAIWCNIKAPNQQDNYSEVWLRGDTFSHRFTFEDEIKQDAYRVIQQLKHWEIPITLLSGDKHGAVSKVARSLGINRFSAEVMPNEKHIYIEKLKKNKHRPLMVGDGLNDAPALRAAFSSISPASALSIAQNSADIVFSGDRLAAILEIITVAKKSDSLVKQNFTMSFVYNLIAIPIAIAGWANPIISAVAMSFSSICVILNSLRLDRD
jgi:Cu2+-exporting ATPase